MLTYNKIKIEAITSTNKGVVKMGLNSTYDFLNGKNEVPRDKLEKIEKMLEKADYDLSRAQTANERIYKRAVKEVLTQVLLVLRED